jgi:hypothetical protein
MIGVAPVQLGIASFQVMFSSALHLSGRFFSVLMPFIVGPRHCGQLSANADRSTTRKMRDVRRSRLRKYFLRGGMETNIRSSDAKEEGGEIGGWGLGFSVGH